jgi:predicted MPP superfamily phosphohydrolase
MQRIDLPPARAIPDGPAVRVATTEQQGESSRAQARSFVWRGIRGRLDAPYAASERRRPMFHPVRGWIRRTERSASHLLTRYVYPWVPGIGYPYSRLLDRRLELSEATIAIRGLPEAFADLRILLVTDVHAGPFITRRTMRRTFDRLARVPCDVVLLGGDLASSSVGEIERVGESFRRLRAPLGVWAVLGNHDHYTRQPDAVIRILAGFGIRTLHNRSVALERDGACLSLAGVDDLNLGTPDLDAALAGTVPPVILLSHNPDLLFEAARMGVALVLSGHTHAGQIRLPRLPVLVRQSRFRLDQGRYRHRATELVVSRGLGAVGIPFRLNCPPEAVLLRLVPTTEVRTC